MSRERERERERESLLGPVWFRGVLSDMIQNS